MDPYERRLAEEVLYLHSLWHQGPPRPNGPNPNPTALTPPHRRHPNPILHSLDYPESIIFKNAHHTHRRALQIFGSKKPEFDPPLVVSDFPWPCHEPSSDTFPADSGWPPFNPTAALPPSLSAEELGKHAANQVQKRGLTACRDFLSRDTGSDSAEKSDSEDDDVEESEVQNFLVTVFMRDEELKAYYEKNWGKGEFLCLVCGCRSGKKAKAKRFKDCVALVQHASAISNTKKRRAHRTYGQAICRILGWDITRLPSIGLPEEV